jgi:hypothetical protein
MTLLVLVGTPPVQLPASLQLPGPPFQVDVWPTALGARIASNVRARSEEVVLEMNVPTDIFMYFPWMKTLLVLADSGACVLATEELIIWNQIALELSEPLARGGGEIGNRYARANADAGCEMIVADGIATDVRNRSSGLDQNQMRSGCVQNTVVRHGTGCAPVHEPLIISDN